LKLRQQNLPTIIRITTIAQMLLLISNTGEFSGIDDDNGGDNDDDDDVDDDDAIHFARLSVKYLGPHGKLCPIRFAVATHDACNQNLWQENKLSKQIIRFL